MTLGEIRDLVRDLVRDSVRDVLDGLSLEQRANLVLTHPEFKGAANLVRRAQIRAALNPNGAEACALERMGAR